MLILDFINVGNGDAALIREMDGERQKFAMMIDCGHDLVERPDDRSRRIYAGEFLQEQGIRALDLVILTHYHRDHIGGLDRVLEHARVGELMCTWLPPRDLRDAELHPDDNDLPRPAQNLLRCLDLLLTALRTPGVHIDRETVLTGERTVALELTDSLKLTVDFGDPCLYTRQTQVYNAALAGRRDRYELLHWGKCMNLTSLRIRLTYRGRDIVFGGDAYAVTWDTDTLAPCSILKVPHHACLSSVTRKYLAHLQPETAVVSVAAGRKDERPHPCIIQLLREYAREVYFTDAVELPGLVEPAYHQAVRLTMD